MNREQAIADFMQSLRSSGLLQPNLSCVVARAPGRLDVMGGIADYSGSLVLQQTVREATFAAIQRTRGDTITVTSMKGPGKPGRSLSMPTASISPGSQPLEYESAAAMFRTPDQHWAAYVIGTCLVLMREKNLTLNGGLHIVIGSEVPEGKGVASSAALEVAVMQAMMTTFELSLEAKDAAMLCQKAENQVAGAPCGIMDQMTSMCGEANALLALVCQPADLLPSVPVPNEIRFWGIDSGERHAVSGSDYGSVRTGAFMGLRILAEKTDRWNGYLANIDPEHFEKDLRQMLPEEMKGREFLKRYGGTTDTVTRIDPDRVYKILQPTAHPIYENARVRQFRNALLRPSSSTAWSTLGELLYESHASYARCGLGSAGTDQIVRLVREAGVGSGLYGARITGGGSGGTVAILGNAQAASSVMEVARQYEAISGYRPHVFDGSSPGAAEFGTRICLL